MVTSNSLSTVIHRLTGVYKDPQRVLRDAEALLNSPLGCHLRPATERLLNNDGTSTPLVLLLSGTLPMNYKGVTYNLPIDIFMIPQYPLRPPTVFVRPVATMAIKENHRHVGLDGQVYLPYLHTWAPTSHNLSQLADHMSYLFGTDPPCYTKPLNAVISPPPYTRLNVQQTPQIPSELEREIAEANLAAETARRAEAEELRVEEERKNLKIQQENLSTMKIILTSKVQAHIQQLYNDMKDKLRIELKDQKSLEQGKDYIQKLLEEGEEQKKVLLQDNADMDTAIEALEQWIQSATEKRNKYKDEGVQSSQDQKQMEVDLIALPADTYSAQMLALNAESAAIDDCIYFLDQALVKGKITLDVFLKEVRKLSKQQFLAKAHLLKISQSRTFSRN